jgi:tight adherence protein C
MFEDLHSLLTNPANVITGLAAVAAFATLWTLLQGMGDTNFANRRARVVMKERERLRKASRVALNAQRRGLRHSQRTALSEWVDKLQLRRLLQDPKLPDKLMQAGLRGERPAAIFYFARLFLPVILAMGAYTYVFLVNDHDMSQTMKIGAVIAAGFLGMQAPGLYLSNIASKRRSSILAVFPDALDLLLICVEAGMSIEAAFHKVAAEIGTSSVELAEELSLTTAELSYLNDRRIAYDNLSKRTNHPGVKAVSTALIQAERYGTPLGTALRVMAKENRDMRLASAEKKAASLPAKLTVPMIVFFLPVLFIVILGPAIIRMQEMGI